MATTTLDGSAPVRLAARRPSLLKRAVGGLMEAREREARRYVNGYLLTLDDATLTSLGYERETLRKSGVAIAAF